MLLVDRNHNFSLSRLISETCVVLPMLFRRILTCFQGSGDETGDQEKMDLRTLRSLRVLRPLKLVSGIPSKYCNLLQAVGLPIFDIQSV